MRGFVVAILILMGISNVKAQVPRWKIHPKYDKIEMLDNGYYIVADNGRYGMSDNKEKEVVALQYDRIAPFRYHYAVLFQNGKAVAYTSDDGQVRDIPDRGYEIVGEPLFFDGYLLLRNSTGYYYLRASDGKEFGPFAGGTPFSESYAVIRVPKSMKHVLDGDYTTHLLEARSGNMTRLNLGEYDDDDVDFASSVSKGKCVIVLKKRFYEYDFIKGVLTPFATDGNTANKKSRVLANERPVQIIRDDKGFMVNSKQGFMRFDPLMRLTSINYTGQTPKVVPLPEVVEEEMQSPINTISDDASPFLGLSYNGKDILTPQFEEVAMSRNNEAIVKMYGKYGVVEVSPYRSCRFTFNDNMAVGFIHKTFRAKIKAECPPMMDPKLMTIESNDCQIDKASRNEIKNVETTALSYDCILSMPEEMDNGKKESMNNAVTFSLNYDGMRFTPQTITYKTKYINYYDVKNLETQMDGSTMIVKFEVKNNKADDPTLYPKKVTVILADSIEIVPTEGTVADVYEVKIDNCETDKIDGIRVNIKEEGCPLISYYRPIDNPNKGKTVIVEKRSPRNPKGVRTNNNNQKDKKKDSYTPPDVL